MVHPAKQVTSKLFRVCMLAAVLGALGCASSAHLPVAAGTGANPTLPPPNKALIPLVHVVPAKGWPQGAKPVAAEGTAVAAFAQGLDHPRWLYVLPNGDVLVAETNGPGYEKPKGLRDLVMKAVMKAAGAGTPSANRITLLRDADGDGVAETRTLFAQSLTS